MEKAADGAICGHWTFPGEEGKKKSVKVYSNCEQLELKLNGRSLGVKQDGKREGLNHPPRVWEVAYEVGTLEAIGRSESQTVLDLRKTCGPPTGIVLRSDVDHVISGDRESLAYINASIVDKDGTVDPRAYNTIAFTSYGPGSCCPNMGRLSDRSHVECHRWHDRHCTALHGSRWQMPGDCLFPRAQPRSPRNRCLLKG